MANQTICGVSLNAFATKPTPEEVASLVASWADDEQAEFFCFFAEQIKNRSGWRDKHQIKAIARALVDLEERLCDGGGSNLISSLHHFVLNERHPEEVR